MEDEMIDMGRRQNSMNDVENLIDRLRVGDGLGNYTRNIYRGIGRNGVFVWDRHPDWPAPDGWQA
jgi:hypothetical protein